MKPIQNPISNPTNRDNHTAIELLAISILLPMKKKMTKTNNGLTMNPANNKMLSQKRIPVPVTTKRSMLPEFHKHSDK
jgi:hypothetical protein